jgi:homoserine O-acetyltransferase/O-succinyltransferase
MTASPISPPVAARAPSSRCRDRRQRHAVTHPPLAPGHLDAPHRVFAMGSLALESGEAIADYRQSFVVHGALNAARANAVLVCPALTATHHRLDFLIGEGKALDPIGNGLSTSPSNSVAQPAMRFPRFVLRDMVGAQRRLLVEHLGIDRLHAVVGASMGGMQALQWAVSHPRAVERVVAMTPMVKTAPWAVLVTETARACLCADPAWGGDPLGFAGRPERGWRAYTGLMNALLMRTPEALERLGIADLVDAQRWFDDLVAQQTAIGFDAHDYLYQSWAYAAHDLGTTPRFGGDTAAALASIVARALLLAPPLDLFNPAAAARAAAAAIAGATFVEIPSINGHMAATSFAADDAAFLNATIGAFLSD